MNRIEKFLNGVAAGLFLISFGLCAYGIFISQNSIQALICLLCGAILFPVFLWFIENYFEIYDEDDDAILFANWISGEGWVQYDGVGRWICPQENKTVLTTKQLYKKFRNSKDED